MIIIYSIIIFDDFLLSSEDATSHDPTASSEAENSASIKEEPFDSRESLESG